MRDLAASGATYESIAKDGARHLPSSLSPKAERRRADGGGELPLWSIDQECG